MTPVLLALLMIVIAAVAALLIRHDHTTSRAATATAQPAKPPPAAAQTPQAPAAPVVPVVAIGAQCATLGAAGVTETGAPAYCSHLSSTDSAIWSLYPGEVSSPTVTSDPNDEVYPSETETPLRVCVEQTRQSRVQCLAHIRHGNSTG